MAAGIYKITNVINDKSYIGSTRRLNERKSEHFYKFRKNKGNSIIKNAILKYGVDNFKFQIIETFTFWKDASTNYIDETLTSREQYCVDILKPEYNIKVKDVTSLKGISSIREINQKEKLSKREISRRNAELGIHKSKKYIDVYHRESLNFIETIHGVRKCALKYNKKSSSISNMCKNGITDSYKGDYIFCCNKENINVKIRKRKINKGYQQKNSNPIIQVDKNGIFIKEFRTMKEAEMELTLCKGSISRVISGEYKNTKNYYFKLKYKSHEL